MPMHYPPLADGTYRYGDAPRPLPSPVPGPDPGQGPTPPAAGLTPPTGFVQGPPGDGSSPAAPIDQRPRNGAAAAVAIVGGLALVVVAVLVFAVFGTGGDPARTPDPLRGPLAQGDLLPVPAPGAGAFAVDGTFTVVSAPGEPVSGTRTGCDMPVSLSDIGEGTTLTLVESDTGRESSSMLAYEGGDLSSCTFSFRFPEVSPGGSLYLIELPGRGQLVYTEDELRAGVEISLGR